MCVVVYDNVFWWGVDLICEKDKFGGFSIGRITVLSFFSFVFFFLVFFFNRLSCWKDRNNDDYKRNQIFSIVFNCSSEIIQKEVLDPALDLHIYTQYKSMNLWDLTTYHVLTYNVHHLLCVYVPTQQTNSKWNKNTNKQQPLTCSIPCSATRVPTQQTNNMYDKNTNKQQPLTCFIPCSAIGVPTQQTNSKWNKNTNKQQPLTCSIPCYATRVPTSRTTAPTTNNHWPVLPTYRDPFTYIKPTTNRTTAPTTNNHWPVLSTYSDPCTTQQQQVERQHQQPTSTNLLFIIRPYHLYPTSTNEHTKPQKSLPWHNV